MRDVMPVSISEARRLWHDWWELPDVVAHVRSRMSPRRFEVAMHYWRDTRDIYDTAVAMRHSFDYVTRVKTDAQRIVRRECLPSRLLGRELPLFAIQLIERGYVKIA